MSSRRNWIFINFTWLLVTGLIWSYGAFKAHFASSPDAGFKVEQLQKQVSNLKEEKAKIAYQFEDFRQNAALDWPQSRKNDYRWPASVSFDLSTSLYDKGRRSFQEKKWDDALLEFEKILTDYPYSKWVAEAQYYTCEIHFQVRDYKDTADCVTQMVQLFPENPLTGFQLMRLAQVHEMVGEPEEALEVYRYVQSQFSSEPILKKQSEESIQRLEKL